jgi:hypothetical protein
MSGFVKLIFFSIKKSYIFKFNFNQKVSSDTDKYVKVLNKGWYIANVQIRYRVGASDASQSASLSVFQSVVFRVPYVVNLDGQSGITLRVDAVAGNNVMNYRVKEDPSCIHVWGTTLITAWSKIDCSFW